MVFSVFLKSFSRTVLKNMNQTYFPYFPCSTYFLEHNIKQLSKTINKQTLNFFFIYHKIFLIFFHACAGVTIGFPLLMSVVIHLYRVYNKNKMKKEYKIRVEKFLEDFRALKPSRYPYVDIKKITNQFRTN